MTPLFVFTGTLSVLVLRASSAAAFVSTPQRPSSPSPTAPATAAATGAGAPLSAVREASFGMGCFWEPSESLLKEPGVLATTVGYTGAPGKKKAPTYDSVCFGREWVEAVRVAYDDEQCSYE